MQEGEEVDACSVYRHAEAFRCGDGPAGHRFGVLLADAAVPTGIAEMERGWARARLSRTASIPAVARTKSLTAETLELREASDGGGESAFAPLGSGDDELGDVCARAGQ